MLGHAYAHIKHIAIEYRNKGKWNGAMTVIRPNDGREYAWNRILSEHHIQLMTGLLGAGHPWSPRGLPKSGVLDLYFDGEWNARHFQLEI
jgi:hypothetical protein